MKSVLSIRKHLKIALDFAAGAEDNTSRPLVIGLNAALFLVRVAPHLPSSPLPDESIHICRTPVRSSH